MAKHTRTPDQKAHELAMQRLRRAISKANRKMPPVSISRHWCHVAVSTCTSAPRTITEIEGLLGYNFGCLLSPAPETPSPPFLRFPSAPAMSPAFFLAGARNLLWSPAAFLPSLPCCWSTVERSTVDDAPVQDVDDGPVQTVDDAPVQTVWPVQTVDDELAPAPMDDAPVQAVDDGPVQTVGDELAPAPMADAPVQAVDRLKQQEERIAAAHRWRTARAGSSVALRCGPSKAARRKSTMREVQKLANSRPKQQTVNFRACGPRLLRGNVQPPERLDPVGWRNHDGDKKAIKKYEKRREYEKSHPEGKLQLYDREVENALKVLEREKESARQDERKKLSQQAEALKEGMRNIKKAKRGIEKEIVRRVGKQVYEAGKKKLR
jgi:hypothetical protein